MSEIEPIQLFPARSYTRSAGPIYREAGARTKRPAPTTFNRNELFEILNLYGRNVSTGEWKDYAIDMQRDRAVFSIFRRTSETPLYRIEKNPKLARRQGMYSIISATGLILKRGHDLKRVLRVLDKKFKLVKS